MKSALKLYILIFFITSILFAQSSFTPPANTPMANGERPRLFFNSNTIVDIRDYLRDYDSADFQSWINAVDGAFNTTPGSKDRNYLLMDAMNFAFLSYALKSGLFGDFSFGRSAADYAAKAYDHAVEIQSRFSSSFIEHRYDHNLDIDKGGFINLSLGAVYDWCHSYLSLAQRQNIADAFIYQYDNRDADLDIGYRMKLSNNIVFYAHAGPVGGIVLYGEDDLGASYQTKIAEMTDMLQWLWIDRMFETGDYFFQGQCGWSESYSYFSMGHNGVFWFAAAFGPAVNQNFVYSTKWLRYTPQYLWSGIIPFRIDGEYTGYWFDRPDDMDLRRSGALTMEVLSTIGMIKNDDPVTAGFAKWLLNESPYVSESDFDSRERRLWWLTYKFFWGSNDVEPVTPTPEDIPLTNRYGLGEFTIKTGYADNDATRITFYATEYAMWHHAHVDYGSINIQKYGTLMLDGGNNKSGYDVIKSEETTEPIFHNVLALYDGTNLYYGFKSGGNAHADIYSHEDNQPGGENHMGNIRVQKSAQGNYHFVDYENTNSHKRDDRIQFKNRKLIYFHDPNEPDYSDQEYLLVYDKVEVSDPSIKKRWIANLPFRPEIVDGAWNEQSTAFWKGSGSTINVTNTYANAHGRMFVKTLAPDNFEYRLRGGPGNFFTDAEGNSLYKTGDYTDWSAYWTGSYRLEIEETIDAGSTVYLNVMQIGDANTMSAMIPVEKLQSGEFLGAFINGDRVAFFNSGDAVQISAAYGVSSSKNVKHLVTGLDAGAYIIKQDGNYIAGPHVVHNNGVLYFESENGGAFSISKSDDNTPPGKPTGLKIE